MKTHFLLAAVTTALSASFVAVAADVPAKDTAASAEQAARAEPVKVKPHSHVEAKGGTAPAVSTVAKQPPKKPLHDHQKFHKQM